MLTRVAFTVLGHPRSLAGKAGRAALHRLMLDFTSHLVARSIFGKRMTNDQLEHIVTGIKTVQGLVLRQIFQPYMIPWFRLSGQTRRYQRIRAAADKTSRTDIHRPTFLPHSFGGWAEEVYRVQLGDHADAPHSRRLCPQLQIRARQRECR